MNNESELINEPLSINTYNWPLVPIADLCETAFDGPFGSNLKSSDYTASGIRVVRLENIGHMHFREELRTYISLVKYLELKKHALFENDIVFSSFVDENVRVCLIPKTLGQAINKADCFCLRIDRNIALPQFVKYQLASPKTYRHFKSMVRGVTRPRVNITHVKQYTISVPIIKVQQRMVERLDRLILSVDTCRARLDRVPQILRSFRKAILEAAVSGMLTVEWRAAHGIRSEWPTNKIAELGELARGKSKHRPRNDSRLYGGPYPFIQTGDVAQSNGTIVRHVQSYSAFGLAQSRLWPADTVCITIAANIADTAMLTYPACFPDSVVGFIADKGKCLPQFIKWSIDARRANLEAFAPATAQKNINLAVLNAIEVPVPTLFEQQEIVRRVNLLLMHADGLDQRLTATALHVNRLTPSLLERAFLGELLPHDPIDETPRAISETLCTATSNL